MFSVVCHRHRHLGRETPAPARKPASDMACGLYKPQRPGKQGHPLFLVLCCSAIHQCYCAAYVSCGMATACVSVVGNVAGCRDSSSKELSPPHRRVNSGNSCQGHHSPEVQANVKLKSLLKSAMRWPHSTGHVVGSYEY